MAKCEIRKFVCVDEGGRERETLCECECECYYVCVKPKSSSAPTNNGQGSRLLCWKRWRATAFLERSGDPQMAGRSTSHGRAACTRLWPPASTGGWGMRWIRFLNTITTVSRPLWRTPSPEVTAERDKRTSLLRIITTVSLLSLSLLFNFSYIPAILHGQRQASPLKHTHSPLYTVYRYCNTTQTNNIFKKFQ